MIDDNLYAIPKPDQEKELISTVALKGLSVLVVEDNVSNFVLMARMLGYLGIHCEWKTSGYEVV